MRYFWPFAANVLFFACDAIVMPFFILYYEQLGFSGPQIGLLIGLPPLVTLVAAPLWTNLADNTRRHRAVVNLLLLGAALCLALLPRLASFWAVLLDIVLLNACFLPVTAFIDSATLFMLADRREYYGRVRVGGSIGFGASGLLAGLIAAAYGLNVALWAGAGLLLLTLVAAQGLEFGAPAPAAHERPARGSVATLLADRSWPPFLALAFAGGLFTVISTNYLLAYFTQIGAPQATLGVALAIGVMTEIPLLFFGDQLLRRFPAYALFVAALLLCSLRLLLFAVVRSPSAALVVQLLNGVNYPLMWLAGVTYAHEHAPPGLAATAQGVLAAMVGGVGAAAAGFAGGPLLAWLGGPGTYAVFGLVILAIVAGVLVWQRLARGT